MRLPMGLLFVALGVHLGAPLRAEEAAAVRKDVQTYYDAMDRTWKRHDLKGLTALLQQFLTPDFVLVFSDGSLRTRAEELGETQFWDQQGGMPLRVQSCKTTLDRLIVQGNKAICVNTTTATVVSLSGRTASGKRPRPYQSVAQSTDLWVKTLQGWRCRERLTYRKTMTKGMALVQVPNREVRDALSAQYAKIEQALNEGNLPEYAAVLTPDYTTRGITGATSDRKQWLAEEQTLMTRYQPFHVYPHSIDKLRVHGNKAVVISEARMLLGKTKLGAFTRDRDTWVKTAQGWRLKRSVAAWF